MSSLVWYAAYGSNLAWDRFYSYIHGGTPAHAARSYQGCRLKRDPLDRDRLSLPHQLYFAKNSPNWQNGGVAFIGPADGGGSATLARLYLLEHEQFEDVVAQENGLDPGQVAIDLDVLAARGFLDVLDQRWYRRVIHAGVLTGHPILTCTAAEDIDEDQLVAPSPKYLWWVCRGLQESWGMTVSAIATYLHAARAMHAYGSLAELRSVVEELVRDGPPSGQTHRHAT